MKRSYWVSVPLSVIGALLASSVQAELLLDISWSKNFPFGPFLPNEEIEIIATAKNVSADQTITICEGVCLGDAFTYSLGGWTSLPSEYDFYFGNIDNDDTVPFDGQIAGNLLPGEEQDFVYGVFVPIGSVDTGWYDFVNRVQIFAATVERPLLETSVFSGQWEVACSPFPGGGQTGGCFPGPGPFPAPEPAILALLGLGLAGLGMMRRRNNNVVTHACGDARRWRS